MVVERGGDSEQGRSLECDAGEVDMAGAVDETIFF